MAIIRVTEAGSTIAVGNNDTVILDIPGGGDVTIIAAGPRVRNISIDYGDRDGLGDHVTFDLETFRSGFRAELTGYAPEDSIALDGETVGGIMPWGEDYAFLFQGAAGPRLGWIEVNDPGEQNLFENPIQIVCFAAGTEIDTPLGPRPVETLEHGDLVVTKDRGPQPIRWTGQRTLDLLYLTRFPELCPVIIRADALGAGVPSSDLVISPQHRMLLDDWRVGLLFDEPEVLAPAKTLIDDDQILRSPVRSVSYHHLLFDRHEIVRANGAWSESLHPGQMAQSALTHCQRGEVRALFPEGAKRPTARRCLKAYEVAALRSFSGLWSASAAMSRSTAPAR